jgi:hypothetical protein
MAKKRGFQFEFASTPVIVGTGVAGIVASIITPHKTTQLPKHYEPYTHLDGAQSKEQEQRQGA